MSPDAAVAVALQALGWIVGEEDLRQVFLGASGATLESLRAGAADAELQAAVLDFLLMDDAWVMRFCDDHGLPYDAPSRALASLPGQALPHWT